MPQKHQITVELDAGDVLVEFEGDETGVDVLDIRFEESGEEYLFPTFMETIDIEARCEHYLWELRMEGED